MASWLAEKPYHEFYQGLQDVASNQTRRFPRGAERRHFRGQNAIDLVSDLRRKYPRAPEDFVLGVSGPSFGVISKRVQLHVGFGPWIAFKIADMLERVFEYPVDFSNCALSMYTEPVKGAVLACEKWGEPQGTFVSSVTHAVDRLMAQFGDFVAPPRPGRFVDIQEIETILCKWKSHMKGHYYVGKDTHEISEGLKDWGGLAQELSLYAPKKERHAA